MAQPPGPKELALRAMRENKEAQKPTATQLRQQIAKTKPKILRKGGRKR